MFADHSHHCEKGAAPERGYPMLSGAALCTTAKAVLSAGRFVASKSYLARRWGIPPTPAYKFMAALESHGLLTHKVVDGICVYTIIEVDKTIDDEVDQTVARRADRQIDYSKDCNSSNNTSSNFVRETTVDTNGKTGIESGRESQYKEVRNKKEEKIYI